MSCTNEDVELACRAFEKSIDQLLARIQKKRHVDEVLLKSCKRLVRHSHHVLRTLAAKRTSLRHAIKAFRAASEEYVKHFSALKDGEDDRRKGILTKWFANYLRLRDGFVLLESGERRHPHDGDDDKGVDVSQRQYPSKLSGAFRRDGVTRKFSSARGYTGAGYDEFNDEDCGIKWRLLDAVAKMGGKSRGFMEERLFDRDGSGAKLFEMKMDEHIDESKALRAQLNSIQVGFVRDVNAHLAARGGQGRTKEKLKLVTDDKFERITLGLVDIARQGNAFSVKDAGGSLPFGMTVPLWKKKFALVPQSKPPSEKAKVVKKKRKVILEDSSDEDEGNAKFVKEPPAKKKAIQSQKQPVDDGHDGLAVRVREATDVSAGQSGQSGGTNGKTTSINEMKRSLGVDNAQLEQGREHMDDEQLRSKMAADDEDMREEVLGEGGNGAAHSKLYKACVSARAELWKTSKNDMELVRESQDYLASIDGSLVQWKEDFQALLGMQKEVSRRSLNGSSDHAYMIRENFREASMLLGIDLLEASDFFSSKLPKRPQSSQSRSSSFVSSLSSLDVALTEICDSHLKFAEEVFRTAYNVIAEQERCQVSSNSTSDIAKHWEKGQHFLLRGRARYNIGRAVYELAQLHESTGEVRKHRHKDLLERAKKEFDGSLTQAKAIRRNTVRIHGHANAKDISNHSNYSWVAEAMLQTVEAIELESLATGMQVACLYNLGSMKDAEQMFDDFFMSTDASDVIKFAGTQGVTHDHVVGVLEAMYSVAVRLAELSTGSLEGLIARKSWSAKVGDGFLRIARKALAQGGIISERLCSLADEHAIDHAHIASRSDIEREEREICKWWETTKAEAQKKLSDFVRGTNAGSVAAGLPRTEVAGELPTLSPAAQLPRRIFIQDSRSLHDRPIRTARAKKNDANDKTVSERFNAEFGSNGNSFNPDDSASPTAVNQVNPTKYRKWGNEVLGPRKRCCPPLPDWLPLDVRRALEKKLGDILPTND